VGGETGGAPRTSNDERGGCEEENLVENGAGKDTHTLMRVKRRKAKRKGISSQTHYIATCSLILTWEAIFQSAGVRDPERGRHREEKGCKEEEGDGKTGTSPSSDSSKTRLSECASIRKRGRKTSEKKLRNDAKNIRAFF
jgi:hypothetical protein